MATDRSAGSDRPVLSLDSLSLNGKNIFSSILHTLEEPFFLLDDTFRLYWYNKACNELYRAVSAEDIGSGFDFNVLLTPEQQHAFQQRLHRVAAGENVHFDWKYQMTAVKWLSVSLYPFLSSDGAFAGVCGSMRDITDKKITEQVLLRNTAVLNNIGEGVLLVDSQFRILTFNRRAIHLYGLWGSEPHIGANILSLVPENRQGDVRQYLQRALGGVHVEYEIAYPDGLWLFISYLPLRNAAGNIEQISVSFRDISERKKAEEEVKAIEQERRHVIVETQELERNLLGRELHDNINQLLATIRLQLAYSLETFPDCRAVLLQCRENVIEVMEEIRYLSHQMVMPRFSERTLPEMLKNLADNYQYAQPIRLDCSKWQDDKAPVPVKEIFFRIAQEQLSNIYKHAKATQVIIRIASWSDSVALSIEDDGVGFSPAEKSGGIGLNNIHSRVESQNGACRIISAPGQGCILLVDIPLIQG